MYKSPFGETLMTFVRISSPGNPPPNPDKEPETKQSLGVRSPIIEPADVDGEEPMAGSLFEEEGSE